MKAFSIAFRCLVVGILIMPAMAYAADPVGGGSLKLDENDVRRRQEDQMYEDNWRIAANDLEHKLSEVCDRLQPSQGTPLDAIIKRYGGPKEMYHPNTFKIRKLEFDFDVHSEERGLKITIPATMVVVLVDDRVAESYFELLDVHPSRSRMSRTGFEFAPMTQQKRYNYLFRALQTMEKVEAVYKAREQANTPK